MNWPEGGGTYDQNPDLLSAWMDIWSIQEEHRSREEAKKNRKKNKKK